MSDFNVKVVPDSLGQRHDALGSYLETLGIEDLRADVRMQAQEIQGGQLTMRRTASSALPLASDRPNF